METSASDVIGANAVLFKSYYVVWKPDYIEKYRLIKNKFKSYYVVWKRVSNISSGQVAWKFKSYYVVWKRFLRRSPPKILFRLNRTM